MKKQNYFIWALVLVILLSVIFIGYKIFGLKNIEPNQPIYDSNIPTKNPYYNLENINDPARIIAGSWRCKEGNKNCFAPFVDFSILANGLDTKSEYYNEDHMVSLYSDSKGTNLVNRNQTSSYEYNQPNLEIKWDYFNKYIASSTYTVELLGDILKIKDAQGKIAEYTKVPECSLGEGLPEKAKDDTPNDVTSLDLNKIYTEGDVTYKYELTPPGTGYVPKIISGASPEVLSIINKKLEDIRKTAECYSWEGAADLRDEVLQDTRYNINENQRECLIKDVRTAPELKLHDMLNRFSDIYYSSSVSYAKNNILSIPMNAEYYCMGSAHPDAGNNNMTFNLKTGEEIPFEKVFTDIDKTMKFIFQDTIADAKNDPTDCDAQYIDPDTFSTSSQAGFSYFVDGKNEGINVSLEFAHVIQACDINKTVPFAMIAPYINPQSPILKTTK